MQVPKFACNGGAVSSFSTLGNIHAAFHHRISDGTEKNKFS